MPECLDIGKVIYTGKLEGIYKEGVTLYYEHIATMCTTTMSITDFIRTIKSFME